MRSLFAITIEEIVAATDASHGTVFRILHNDLDPVKKEARWVPKERTDEMKRRSVELARHFLRHYAAWRYQILTCDETYI